MISLIILSHNKRDSLATHLPSLLTQQGAEYEVIVVDMHSEDDTIDMLLAMEEEHDNLRHLSLPANARDISHERLALHLGMRAAITSRVLLLEADTELPSDHWLADALDRWTPEHEMILIPTVRERARLWGDYFTAGHEAWRNLLYLRQANVKLFRAGNAVVGLDKGIFLRYNAPARHLALKTGTMDIFMSRTATGHNPLVITEPPLFPRRDAAASTCSSWAQQRVFDAETSRHLSRRFLRGLTYMQHCLCTIHKGALLYCLEDLGDNIRWCLTRKRTFIKKHY